MNLNLKKEKKKDFSGSGKCKKNVFQCGLLCVTKPFKLMAGSQSCAVSQGRTEVFLKTKRRHVAKKYFYSHQVTVIFVGPLVVAERVR